MKDLRGKMLAELLGTFAMVFAGTGSMVINHVTGGMVTHVGISITWGLVILAMVYAFGETSGAHFNPAVTIAFCIAGVFPLRRVLPYALAQVSGAMLASALLRYLFGNIASLGISIPAGSAQQSFVLEIVLAFLLMLVILLVAQGSKEQGLMAGMAIGAVIGLEAMFAGPICGASMNPARSLGPAIVSGNLSSVWIYLFAPVIGSVLAVPCWSIIRQDTEKARLVCQTPSPIK